MKLFKIALCAFIFTVLLVMHASAQPDALYKTKQEIENTSFTVSKAQANNEKELKHLIEKRVLLMLGKGIDLQGITITQFVLPNEKDGSFSFSATLYTSEYKAVANVANGVILNSDASVIISADSFIVEQNKALILNAEATQISSEIHWYESNSPDKIGNLLAKSNEASISIDTSAIGTKYVYCICGGIVSNTVKIEITKPFVPTSDIEIDLKNVTYNIPFSLDAAVFPTNATVKSISWKVLSGNATISGGKLIAKTMGEVTIEARIKNGAEGKNDFFKTFTVLPKENTSSTGSETWVIDTPQLSDILSVVITGKYETEVQITALSPLTTEKILSNFNSASAENIISTAYIVCNTPDVIKAVTLDMGVEYAGKDITVFYEDANGIPATVVGKADENGDVNAPVGNSYIVTLNEIETFDFSLLFFLIPIIPLITVLVFKAIATKAKKKMKF